MCLQVLHPLRPRDRGTKPPPPRSSQGGPGRASHRIERFLRFITASENWLQDVVRRKIAIRSSVCDSEGSMCLIQFVERILRLLCRQGVGMKQQLNAGEKTAHARQLSLLRSFYWPIRGLLSKSEQSFRVCDCEFVGSLQHLLA